MGETLIDGYILTYVSPRYEGGNCQKTKPNTWKNQKDISLFLVISTKHRLKKELNVLSAFIKWQHTINSRKL